MGQQQSLSGNPSDGVTSRLSFDPSLPSYYRVSAISFFASLDRHLDCHKFQWLAVVSLAVLYNIIFVVGRAIFWEINKKVTFLWYTLDYLCDFIYLLDTLVHWHEGEFIEHLLLLRYMLNLLQ
jgi:hypothetical protein